MAHFVYAEFKDDIDIGEVAAYLAAKHADVQWGSQGDDWIWVHFGEVKIEIDTFYSMRLLVHAPDALEEEVRLLLDYLQRRFALEPRNPPEEASWT